MAVFSDRRRLRHGRRGAHGGRSGGTNGGWLTLPLVLITPKRSPPPRPELMCHPVNQLNFVHYSKKPLWLSRAWLRSTIVGESLWDAVLECQLPLVVDADALNFLAKKPTQHLNWIITPPRRSWAIYLNRLRRHST